jgi:restriction system protein
MALWLVRAGGHGEFEDRFLQANRIYLTWERLKIDLGRLETWAELRQVLDATYPGSKPGRTSNHAGQIWPFAHDMKKGDWVVIPSKKRPAIHFAEIVGDYTFSERAEDPYFHSREIKWVARDVPRSVFDQDLLYSFGAFMTICRIERNDAEKRVRALAEAGWTASRAVPVYGAAATEQEGADAVDLGRLARDTIAKLIIRQHKGHGLARLVEAILKAQGYSTHLSPEGPDNGIDILAAPGPLGFGNPRLCVQVKSGDRPVDTPTLHQLIGAMQNVHADQGLLVSWGGFKSSVEKEIPTQFFRVRLWDQDALIDELLGVYDELDETWQVDLPLKKIWVVARDDGED